MRVDLALQLGLCAAFVCAPVAAVGAQPILKMEAESSTRRMGVPGHQVVDVIIGSLEKDDIVVLDQCLEYQKLKPHDYRHLLRSVVFRPSPGHLLHFVRASDVACSGWYGAHSFQYYLVEESRLDGIRKFKIVFEDRGDRFAVYDKVNHGLNEIEATGCIAIECRSARMSFDGQQYRPIRCTRTTFNRNREIREPRPCGSDDWRDDQSSGFALAPNK